MTLLDAAVGWGASSLMALRPCERARELANAGHDERGGDRRAGRIAAHHHRPRGTPARRLALDAAAGDGGAPATPPAPRSTAPRPSAATPRPPRAPPAP